MTPDHKMLAFGINNQNVYIYKYNESSTNYTESQIISFGAQRNRWVDLTDDYQFLTIAGKGDNNVKLYKLDND